MTVRLHLRRLRVVEVAVDVPERLEVVVEDVRSVVRCGHCGFKTDTVHDRRRVRVTDLSYGGRRTTLVWLRRRFRCDECGERFLEECHPEFVRNRVTWITRRPARSLVRDVNRLPIRELSRRRGLGWHFIMDLVASWSSRVVAERRQRRCRVLMVDETSLRRRHRYVTVLINGETGEGLGVVKHRDANALNGFLAQQGHRWLKGVRVVVTDGSESYRSAIRAHLGHATHVVDRFHVARWFASGLIEVRRRIQRIGPKGSRPPTTPRSSDPDTSSYAEKIGSSPRPEPGSRGSWPPTRTSPRHGSLSRGIFTEPRPSTISRPQRPHQGIDDATPAERYDRAPLPPAPAPLV
jgi:transposase